MFGTVTSYSRWVDNGFVNCSSWYLISRKKKQSQSYDLHQIHAVQDSSLNEHSARYEIGHDSPISLLTVGETGHYAYFRWV